MSESNFTPEYKRHGMTPTAREELEAAIANSNPPSGYGEEIDDLAEYGWEEGQLNTNCPFCHSDNIYTIFFESVDEEEKAVNDMECEDCNRAFPLKNW